MMTFFEKIKKVTQEHSCSSEVTFSSPEIVNPLGGDKSREYVPLWLQLLPENSEEVKLPEEVKDAVYSPEGEVYPSIDYDPRAGFFERADAHSAAVAEKLGSMSLRHYSDYEAASLSNSEDEFLAKLDAAEQSSVSAEVSTSAASADSASPKASE